MTNSKRNQQDPSRDEMRSYASMQEQQGETQDASNENENPQRGGSDENFYRNRERGNYEEGQRSDEGEGGSLY